MLTITNYNQQTPTFQARMNVGQVSSKVGKYLEGKGINSSKALLASAGLAGTTGTVILASPNVIYTPDAAKWAIGTGMASTLGIMGLSYLKTKHSKSKPKINENTVANATESKFVVSDDINEKHPQFAISDKFYEISSPMGILKLSENGVKQYAEVADLYSKGKPRENKTYYSEGQVIKAKLMMEVLNSLGEFSTKYNNVIKTKAFGEIKVTEKGLQQFLDAIDLYAKSKPKESVTYHDEEQVMKAKHRIYIIAGHGEL